MYSYSYWDRRTFKAYVTKVISSVTSGTNVNAGPLGPLWKFWPVGKVGTFGSVVSKWSMVWTQRPGRASGASGTNVTARVTRAIKVTAGVTGGTKPTAGVIGGTELTGEKSGANLAIGFSGTRVTKVTRGTIVTSVKNMTDEVTCIEGTGWWLGGVFSSEERA